MYEDGNDPRFYAVAAFSLLGLMAILLYAINSN